MHSAVETGVVEGVRAVGVGDTPGETPTVEVGDGDGESPVGVLVAVAVGELDVGVAVDTAVWVGAGRVGVEVFVPGRVPDGEGVIMAVSVCATIVLTSGDGVPPACVGVLVLLPHPVMIIEISSNIAANKRRFIERPVIMICVLNYRPNAVQFNKRRLFLQC
jgi:hypothetical protein